MKFTGKNLARVHDALYGHISDMRNEISTCPDVVEYAEDLDYYEEEIAEAQKLLDRIEKTRGFDK
jgi:hypothetical protein